MTRDEQAEKERRRALVAAAARIAETYSVFWTIDHPMAHPATAAQFARSKPPREQSSMLEGVRASLAGAERLHRQAKAVAEDPRRVIQAAEAAAPAELREFMPAQIQGVLNADLQRAWAEVKHWREYVAHYEKQTAPPPRLTTNSFAIPKHWSDVSDDDIPF